MSVQLCQCNPSLVRGQTGGGAGRQRAGAAGRRHHLAGARPALVAAGRPDVVLWAAGGVGRERPGGQRVGGVAGRGGQGG